MFSKFTPTLLALLLCSRAVAIEIRLTFDGAEVTEKQALEIKDTAMRFFDSIPSCLKKPEILGIGVLKQSSGAESTIWAESQGSEEVHIPAVNVPYAYYAYAPTLQKSVWMLKEDRDTVLLHEIGHAIFNENFDPTPVLGVWPELEKLVAEQEANRKHVNFLYEKSMGQKTQEIESLEEKSSALEKTVNALWVRYPEKATAYQIRQDNPYLSYALTEFFADLLVAALSNNPGVIEKALSPTPLNPAPAARLRGFLPLNKTHLKNPVEESNYKDLPGYTSTLENDYSFSNYWPRDLRDAHLSLNPLRVFVWDKYFKGKNTSQRKNEICKFVGSMNERARIWGAWKTSTPKELNALIINELKASP